MKNLVARNGKDSLLPDLASSERLHFVSRAEVDAAFDSRASNPSPRERWEAFYQHFKGAFALVELSLPGYSANRSVAVVYGVYARGSLSAEGNYFRRARRNGKWLVLEHFRVWAS
jgi:hypothetical protein